MAGSMEVLRWISFVVACLAMLTSGSALAFNAYAREIKDMFHLSQSHIELMAALGNLGACMGLPAGVLLEAFGARWASFSSMILLMMSNLLLWNTTLYVDFYHSNYGLIVLYMFIYGCGTILLYMTALSTNMGNFSSRHRGTVVGITGALWWIGPAIFAAVYNVFYQSDENLAGFFILKIIIFAVVGSICVSFLCKIPLAEDTYTEKSSLVTGESDKSISEDVGFAVMIKNPDFHLLLWNFSLSCGVQVMFFNNLVFFLRSFDLHYLNMPSTVIGPVVGFFGKLSIGIISDNFLNTISRPTYIVFMSVLQTVIFIFCIFLANHASVFMLAVVITYTGNGVSFTIHATIVSEKYGMKHFSRNWGTLMIAFGLFSWGIMALFGFLYDLEAEDDTLHRCFGLHCFTVTFILASVISLIATILAVVLLYRSRLQTSLNANINQAQSQTIMTTQNATKLGENSEHIDELGSESSG